MKAFHLNTYALLLVLVLLPGHEASLINPSTWLSYLFPATSSDDNRNIKELTTRINHYEATFAAHLTTNRRRRASKEENAYSRHIIRKVADTLTCSYYSPHSFAPLETVCKDVRFHRRHFLSVKPNSEIIILTFRSVARVDTLLRHVLNIFERVEALLPQVEEALRRTRAKRVIYAGRGSGGAIASLLAFRLSNQKPTSVITLDEFPVYSDVLRRLHPVSPSHYLSFITEESDQVRKQSSSQPFKFCPSQVIDLSLAGVDVLFEPEPEAIDPKYFLPEGLTVTKKISAKVQADLLRALKSTHAAAKKMTTVYMLEREDLQQAKALRVIHQLESDLNKQLLSPKKKVRFRCQLRSPQAHSFQVLCEYGSAGYPAIEFLARIDSVTEKKEACGWLGEHAVPFESEQASADLKDQKHLSHCFRTLFSPRKSPYMRYFLFDAKHCHYYDFGEGTGQGAHLIPLGSPALLVELMEKAPAVFYSLIPIESINIPRECEGILPPILSSARLTPLKRLAAEFLKERTRLEDPETSLFDRTLTLTKSFKTTQMHIPKRSEATELPEHYYFKLALCLTSELMPTYDCTDPINQWAGYCPEACLGTKVGPLCRNVVRCEGAGFYAAVAPTGFLRGLKREMVELKRQLEDRPRPFPLYAIYEVQSLKQSYSRLYRQFYLSLIQIEGLEYASSSNSSVNSSGSSTPTTSGATTPESSHSSSEDLLLKSRKLKSRKIHQNH